MGGRTAQATGEHGVATTPARNESPDVGRLGSPGTSPVLTRPSRVASSQPHITSSPIVILAPARSCTSVFTAMLGQHPECFAFPELQVFANTRIEEFIPSDDAPGWERYRRAGAFRALAYLHEGADTLPAIMRAKEWMRRRADWTVTELFEYLLSAVSPKRGIEKSPETVFTTATLRRALTMCPHAQYIHLVRHPTTTIQSMEKHWKPSVPNTERRRAVDILRRHCTLVWLNTHRLIMKATELLPEAQITTVQIERVFLDPEGEMRKLAEWLGLDTGTRAIESMLHPERWEFAHPGPPGARGGADPAFLADSVLRRPAPPPAVEVPPGWALDDDLWQQVGEVAMTLGYS